MEYNWKIAFQQATSEAIYKEYISETKTNSIKKELARQELENRYFDFKNIDKNLLKWELEFLYEEEKSEKSGFFKQGDNYHRWLMTGIMGIIFTLIAFGLIIHDYSGWFDPSREKTPDFIFLIGGISFMTIGFFRYKLKKRRTIYREYRIKELIKII